MSEPSRPHVRRFRRRTVRLRVELVMDGETRSEWATTLGAGGLFVETQSLLPVGKRLSLRFCVPQGDVLHELAGLVAWATPPALGSESPERSRGMGIEFTDVAATARLARELEREPESVA